MPQTPPTPPPKDTTQRLLDCDPSRVLPTVADLVQALAVSMRNDHPLVDKPTSEPIFLGGVHEE